MLFRRDVLRGGAALAATAVAGCAAPIAGTRGQAVPGSFAWFDFVTEAPDKAEAFYAGLFGWQASGGASGEYRILSSGGTALGGIVAARDVDADVLPASQWVPVLTVSDAKAAAETAVGAGGRVLLDTARDEDGSAFVSMRDNRGAVVVLYSGSDGFPLATVGTEGVWFWADLFTDSTSQSQRFYNRVAGFETRQEGGLTLFTSGGEIRAGMVRVPRSQIAPTWMPYVLVSDLDATIARAKQLGGNELVREGGAALIVDAVGGVVGITDGEV